MWAAGSKVVPVRNRVSNSRRSMPEAQEGASVYPSVRTWVRTSSGTAFFVKRKARL